MSAIWDRVYRVLITRGDDEALLVDGLKGGEQAQIQFRVDVSANGSQKFAQITIFGLSAESRRDIYRRFDRVILSGGYREDYTGLFEGRIHNVTIGSDGPEKFVTLYCRATGEEWEQASINKAWGPGTPAKEVIRDVSETFGYPIEFVGDFSDLPKLINGLTMSQNSKFAMRGLARNYSFEWLISDGQMVITRLGARRTDPSAMFTISADTGMIGTPRITQKGIDVTLTMNGKIRPGDTVLVQAETGELTFSNPSAVGRRDVLAPREYEVQGVTHSGDLHDGAWQTVLECLNPQEVQLVRDGPQ